MERTGPRRAAGWLAAAAILLAWGPPGAFPVSHGPAQERCHDGASTSSTRSGVSRHWTAAFTSNGFIWRTAWTCGRTRRRW